LPIATPRLEVADIWGKFPYIIMERLSGEILSVVFKSLTPDAKRQIIIQIAEAIRAMHRLPQDLFRAAPCAWHPFIDSQQANLLANHQNFGLDNHWISQLTSYCDSIPMDLHNADRMAPLHTELMLEHLFVTQNGTDWNLSGLIDFEPSMIGHHEYEFCAVGLFITRGNRDLFRRFLSSYGYAESELTPDLSRRIMKFLLLHRYSNLKWFMTMIPPERNMTALAQLEQYWFGF
jgi:hygromycin-B 7''-O-kinase